MPDFAFMAESIANQYFTDCDSVVSKLKDQKSKMLGSINDARRKEGNGWDKVLLSRQELRLAEAEFQQALQRYRTDCLAAKRNRSF
jgi:hypothetical protein